MRYLISPPGDVVSLENGYRETMSLCLVDCLGSYAVSDRKRRLRFIREELNFELEPGEPEDAIFTEDCEGARRPDSSFAQYGLSRSRQRSPQKYDERSRLVPSWV